MTRLTSLRSGLLLCWCVGILACLGAGCSSSRAVNPAPVTSAAEKVSPALSNAAQQLESGAIEAPLTGQVRSDAAGNIQVYVHVTDTSDAHLDELGKHGLQNMLASPALRIVQGWVKPQELAELAALPFVTRITPPQYAIPR